VRALKRAPLVFSVWCFDLIFSSDLLVRSDDECRRRASAFKEQREPSGVSFEFILWRPSSSSAGLPSRRRLQSSSSTVAWTAGRCAVSNNCPGYSSVTVYSFCAVL
jgi:hypothetical protein